MWVPAESGLAQCCRSAPPLGTQRPLGGCLLACEPRTRTAAPPGLSGDASCRAPWVRVQGARRLVLTTDPKPDLSGSSLTLRAPAGPARPLEVCWSYCLFLRSCSYFICIYLFVTVDIQCYMRSRCGPQWLDVCVTYEVTSFPKFPRDTTVITGTLTLLLSVPLRLRDGGVSSVSQRDGGSHICLAERGTAPVPAGSGQSQALTTRKLRWSRLLCSWDPGGHGCPAGLADKLFQLLSGSLESQGISPRLLVD